MRKLSPVFALLTATLLLGCEREEGFTLYSAKEWERISGLAHLQAPPPDRSAGASSTW